MKIVINDRKTGKIIQKEFNDTFPFLKIEVFSRSPQPGGGTAKRFMLERYKTIYECRAIHNNGELEIVPEMTVTELEKSFSNMFGLSVQVFRKSGKVWLETTTTDHCTLEEQNKLGEMHTKTLEIDN